MSRPAFVHWLSGVSPHTGDSSLCLRLSRSLSGTDARLYIHRKKAKAEFKASFSNTADTSLALDDDSSGSEAEYDSDIELVRRQCSSKRSTVPTASRTSSVILRSKSLSTGSAMVSKKTSTRCSPLLLLKKSKSKSLLLLLLAKQALQTTHPKGPSRHLTRLQSTRLQRNC